MKTKTNITITLVMFTIGILVGRYVQYEESKDANAARMAEYVKILADQRKAHVALDHLKHTIASKCNDVYEKREYVPFEGALRTVDYGGLCWASNCDQ